MVPFDGNPVQHQLKADLLAAARLLEERGWCQGFEITSSGRMCMLGAMKAAAGFGVVQKLDTTLVFEKPTDGRWTRFFAMFRVVEKRLPTPVSYYNDNRDRTKEEVVAKLREIADAV